MNEILFLCGSNERAVIASLGILDGDFVEFMDAPQDEVLLVILPQLTFFSHTFIIVLSPDDFVENQITI